MNMNKISRTHGENEKVENVIEELAMFVSVHQMGVGDVLKSYLNVMSDLVEKANDVSKKPINGRCILRTDLGEFAGEEDDEEFEADRNDIIKAFIYHLVLRGCKPVITKQDSETLEVKFDYVKNITF